MAGEIAIIQAYANKYGYNNVQSHAWESDESAWERNNLNLEMRWRETVTVEHTETYDDYIYNWVSQWHNVYDRRDQFQFQVVTQPTEITDYRPIYETSTQDVMVVNMKDVTVWKTVPIVEQQTVLRTEVTLESSIARGGDFDGESIHGATITIDSGASVRLSGKLAADTTLDIDADSLLQLKGNIPASGGTTTPIETYLTAANIDLHAGENLTLDDTARVTASAASGTAITLDSSRDMTLGGDVTAEDSAVIDINADRNIALSGRITAGNITLDAGDGVSQDGGITGDSDVYLKATTGDLSLTTGLYGGSIVLNGSTLEAVAAGHKVDLNAAGGYILQVAQTLNDNSVTASQASGRITADLLEADADNGMTLNANVKFVDLELSEAGNIQLTNQQSLDLTHVVTADGAIDVTVFGNLVVTDVRTLGSSDRNDVSLTTHDLTLSSSADITVINLQNGARGDLSFSIEGKIDISGTSTLVADALSVRVAGGLTLTTQVNSLSVETTRAGDVSITQGTRALVLTQSRLAEGDFSLEAGDFVNNVGGKVDVADVRILSNKDAVGDTDADISIKAVGDILVRYASAGIYTETDADKPVVRAEDGADGAVVSYSSATSAGDIKLESTRGRIGETYSDSDVDIVADRLTLRAYSGITSLEDGGQQPGCDHHFGQHRTDRFRWSYRKFERPGNHQCRHLDRRQFTGQHHGGGRPAGRRRRAHHRRYDPSRQPDRQHPGRRADQRRFAQLQPRHLPSTPRRRSSFIVISMRPN